MQTPRQVTGTPIAGRFKPLRILGEGGYGVVYEALDTEWSARVALKTLQRMDPDALLRFKEEFRSLQDIEHTNLVHLGELMCSDGLWFFTMELVEGTDFMDYVRPVVAQVASGALRVLNVRRLRSALAQLADALIAVHGSGRVHCDLKPSNIRVDAAGRVVLLDFGLVTAVAKSPTATLKDNVLGTPMYMAPEQARGEALTAAADMYALGVVLYEALTGRPPIDGSAAQVMMNKQHVLPPPPHQLAPASPSDLSELCMELLRIHPASRPTSAGLLSSLTGQTEAGPTTATHSVPASPPASSPPFIGRTEDLSELRATLTKAREGKPTFTYLSGESGLGKTALVQRFASEVEASEGALVLKSRCYERETVPYKAFDGIVDDLAHHLSALEPRVCRRMLPGDIRLLMQVFPVLGRVDALLRMPPGREPQDPNVQRSLAFSALREVLARLALERPLILVIDDLQWTDTDSLYVLEELLSGPQAPSCMVIATGRPVGQLPTALREALAPLLRSELAHELPLKGLDDAETIALASALVQRKHESGVYRRIAQDAKGHPLFVTELVRHIETGHTLDGTRHLDDALRARLGRMKQETRTLLEVLAVASAPLAHTVLARALELDATELGRRLAQLRVAHLARSEDRARSECYHDRVRKAVLEATPQNVRELHHRALAVALTEVGHADSEQIAEQWACAGDTTRAARHYATAAEAAHRALAFNRAVRLYEQALLHPEAFPEEKVLELRVACAQSLSCAGFSARAAQAYIETAALHDGQKARTLRRLATQLLLRSGRITEGLELADTVLAEVGMTRPTTPTRAVARLLWERTRLWARGLEHKPLVESSQANEEVLELLWAVAPSLSFVDILGGTALQSQYVRMALSSGDQQHVVRALTGHALMLSSMEPPPQTRVTALLARARQIGDASKHPYCHALVRLSHGYAHWTAFRLKEAVAQLVQAERILRESCVDVAWELTNSRAGLLNALWNSGNLWQHDELAHEWQRDARERGDSYASAQLAVIGMRYQVALRADDPDRADAILEESLHGWPDTFQLPQWGAYIGRQLAALYRGDGSAYQLVTAKWREIRRSQLLHAAYLAFLTHCDAAWACVDEATRAHADRRAALLRQALRHVNKLAATRRPLAGAFANQIQGQILLLSGRDVDALSLLQRAHAELRQQGSVYQHGTAYLVGKVMGGEEGAALVIGAETWARREGVVAPERWLPMFAPAVRSLA